MDFRTLTQQGGGALQSVAARSTGPLSPGSGGCLPRKSREAAFLHLCLLPVASRARADVSWGLFLLPPPPWRWGLCCGPGALRASGLVLPGLAGHLGRVPCCRGSEAGAPAHRTALSPRVGPRSEGGPPRPRPQTEARFMLALGKRV